MHSERSGNMKVIVMDYGLMWFHYIRTQISNKQSE